MAPLHHRTIQLYRIIGIVVALVVIGIPFLIPADEVTTDPLWLRFTIGGIIGGISVGAFFIPYLRDRLLYFMYGYGFILIAWLFWLAFINNLRLDYSPTPLICMVVTGIGFRHRQFLWLFLGGLFIASCAFSPLSDDSFINPFFYLTIELMIIIGLGFLMQNLLVDRQRLQLKEKRQKAIMVAAFEYSDDGILVVDAEGQILDQNPRFLELWGLTTSDIEADGHLLPLPGMLDAVADPQGFMATSRQANAHPEKPVFQSFRLKNGRHMERFSKPLWMDRQAIGRIWFYKDMTENVEERKSIQQEKNLLAAENAALSELGAGINDPDYGLDQAIDHIGKLGNSVLKGEVGTVWWLDGEQKHFELLRCWGGNITEMPARLAVEDLRNFLRQVRNERLLASTPRQTHPKWGELPGKLAHLTQGKALLIPLRSAQKVQGFFIFTSTQPQDWTRDERGFAGSLGDTGSIILEFLARKRSEQALQSALRESRAVLGAHPDSSLLIDADGHIHSAHPGSAESAFSLPQATHLSDMLSATTTQEILATAVAMTDGAAVNELRPSSEPGLSSIRISRISPSQFLLLFSPI